MKKEFIRFSLTENVLKFGAFQTKAGRLSPYFFNTGEFNNGDSLKILGQYYAKTLLDSGIEFDLLFGSAYKGITLAASTAIALAKYNKKTQFCYNRKEIKQHGEGGILIGAPLTGRIVIIDDVLSSGVSAEECMNIINSYSTARIVAILIAFDRMEESKIQDIKNKKHSTTKYMYEKFGIPVISIINLLDLITFLQHEKNISFKEHLIKIKEYIKRYNTLS